MDTTSYVALSHLTALRRKMDMVANNIANMNTPSYKAEKPLFTEFLFRTTEGEKVAYVEDFGSVRNLELGTITPTGNPLDLALNGAGYYKAETPQGIRFTRAGQFQLDAEGTIVTRQGYPLLDDGDKPIEVPIGTRNITISNDGVVSADGLLVGRIVPVVFDNERDLKKLPNGFYETDQQAEPAPVFEIRQGMIEESNVQGVLEMTQMIDVARSYESARRFLDKEDERVRTAIRKLSGMN